MLDARARAGINMTARHCRLSRPQTTARLGSCSATLLRIARRASQTTRQMGKIV